MFYTKTVPTEALLLVIHLISDFESLSILNFEVCITNLLIEREKT